MPKKKKNQITGFTMYMKDIMPHLKAAGEMPANAGIAQCVPIAHPRWKNLPQAEKEKYERKAREEKAKAGGGGAAGASAVRPDRLDNIGNIISQRVDKDLELEKKRKRESKMQEARWLRAAENNNDILEYVFYVISFEYLCRTAEGEYLPVEVAIVEFSLLEGIKRVFHKFIHHGPIPLGYRFECQQHSDDTHQIPIDFELADDDYLGIWLQMQNFINHCEKKEEYPPMYCLGSERECVEYCIDWLHRQTDYRHEKNKLEKIFELENMVSNLYAKSENQNMNRPSRTTIIESLTTSAWDYEYGTRCRWHEEKEVKDCALGKCKRFVYAISDTSSNLWETIELQPGKHLPVRDDEPPYEVINPSSIEMVKPSFSRGRATGRGRFGGEASSMGGFGARDVRFKNQQQDEVAYSQNQFEDSDPTPFQPTMRRPNIPEVAGPDAFRMAPWATATTQAHVLPPEVNDIQEFPSLGAMPQDPVPHVNSTEDFPLLGGGMPKFAGRREPPPASHAPSPPSSWSMQQQQKPSIHDAVRMMEEEETRQASPTTTDYYSDSSNASSQSKRKLHLHEAVRLQEQEELERQMRAMESQKQRLPSIAPKALGAGRAQPVGRGRGRGMLGAPKSVNVPGGMGRGAGLLGGVGRGQQKMANKPPINMGKPPPSLVASQDSHSSSSWSSQNHRLPQGNTTFGINMGQPPSSMVKKPTVENDKVSISGWSSASQQSVSKSIDEHAYGDHDDASSTATWDSVFSGLPSVPQQAGFCGDSMDFPTLAQSTSQQKPKPSLGRGRGVLQVTDYIRPPPGFHKSDLEEQFSDINVGE